MSEDINSKNNKIQEEEVIKRVENNNFLKNFYIFLKDSILLVIYPTKQTSIILKRKYSIPFVFFIVCFFSGLHFLFNHMFFDYYYIHIQFNLPLIWDWTNIIGLYWQIVTFVFFIISLSALLIDLICSKFSKNKNNLFAIAKIYLHILIIFGFYPLINWILVVNRINPILTIKSGFQTILNIQIGQMVEGMIIGVISIFVIYKLYKTKLGTLLCIIVIALLFIYIGGMYLDFVYVIANALFANILSMNPSYVIFGLPYQPFHIILWAYENLLEILLVVIAYIVYLFINRTDFQNELKWIKSYSFFLFIFLPYIGFLLGIQWISSVELIILILSIITGWGFINLLIVNSERNNQIHKPYKNKWELTFITYFLITVSLSLSLCVSFFATLCICLFIIIGIIYCQFQNKVIIRFLLFGLLCSIALAIGATPFSFYHYSINFYEAIIQILSESPQINIAKGFTSYNLFYLFSFTPSAGPDLNILIISLIIGFSSSLLKEIIIILIEKGQIKLY